MIDSDFSPLDPEDRIPCEDMHSDGIYPEAVWWDSFAELAVCDRCRHLSERVRLGIATTLAMRSR